jgi:hypothetical protein
LINNNINGDDFCIPFGNDSGGRFIGGNGSVDISKVNANNANMRANKYLTGRLYERV